ncbi:hypothetical protein BD324DRAFT_639720 [Kockovaella imperatae]|uniref:Succinate dehydrogenase assembly factor 3 n=1 Tax=Kockovaella imperatae TaxID=4999 RepID=A0A1Y1U5W4_9TREE|nr:hypothetical protein BD324DRAFT_639720 [Kockovaella imperatae]ORX33419.1 hypothetical protein BD324DRAFT_639720 [Kockovaella imperatae]
MRPSLLRRAAATLPIPPTLAEASMQLIPPIPLYRRLLRAHRGLPDDMRFMGDAYIKSEFRATRTSDNPIHIIAFLSQWKLYLEEVEQSATEAGKAAPFKGRRLEVDKIEQLSEEQIGQLYELMHATKDVWKSPEDLTAQAGGGPSGSLNPSAPEDDTKDK